MSTPSATGSSNITLWERLWRGSGISFVIPAIIAYFVAGPMPEAGASASALVSYYDGDSARILIATVIFGFATLNLLWFVAAIKSALRDAGRGGWGTAATIAGTVSGSMFFVILALGAALAHSVAGSGSNAFTSGLNDVIWACIVLSSFPRAMLVMAPTFGLWRAGRISNAMFSAGVAALILVLLGGTTWASGGFWAPDGVYSRIISPVIFLVSMVAFSSVLARSPSTHDEW
jgi:hypothetical protein